MPLGDSFTIGEYDASTGKRFHYRKKLYKNLVSQLGYNISFVGSSIENTFHKSPHHEGHHDWSISKFTAHSHQLLDMTDPDIVLLLVGTADVEKAVDLDAVEKAMTEWDDLIQSITMLRPFSYIIASNLPPPRQPWVVGEEVTANIDHFNSGIESIVNRHASSGNRISFLDMHSVLSQVPNTPDVIFNEMGLAWSEKIQEVMGPHGDGLRPGVLRIRGGLDRRHITITFTKAIVDVKMAKRANYRINNGLGIWSGSIDPLDDRSIVLRASKLHVPGKKYTISILKGATNIPDRPLQHWSVSKSKVMAHEHSITSISFFAGWRYLAISDLHLAEKYVFDKSPYEQENDIKIIQYLKKSYGGDFVTISGDTNAGFWDRPSFREKMIDTVGRHLSPQETVLEAGDRCYSGLYDAFRKGGYWNLVMAYGDHEAGDNRWSMNSLKSRLQPQFRHIFARSFNFDYDGNFKYDTPIGNATSRPIGTDFEHTSYAYKHENVLLVTVDVLYQKSPSDVVGHAGTVTGSVNGDHLEWFDKVLAEGRRDTTIKHIFVQGHFPVLYPVRKTKSSGMYMDGGDDSQFWKVMRKHGVDIYFSGEVHQNTVTKDPESSLIQIASRGNYFSQFLSIDVTHTTIDIACHREYGSEQTMYNYDHKLCGGILITKQYNQTGIDYSWGELALLDRDAPMIYFDFEDIVELWTRSIVGLGDVLHGDRRKPVVANFPVQGVNCQWSIPNKGEFGQNYDAVSTKLNLVDGIVGTAAEFDVRSRAAVWGMGPHSRGRPVSMCLWFRTSTIADALLIAFEGYWPKKEVMNLRLRNGRIELSYSATQKIIALGSKVKSLNDDEWHHVAVSTPWEDSLLSEIKFFIDGQAVLTNVTGTDDHVSFPNSGQVSLGGFGHGRTASGHDSTRDGFLKGDRFVGYMDEVYVWSRPISFEEVQILTKTLRSE